MALRRKPGPERRTASSRRCTPMASTPIRCMRGTVPASGSRAGYGPAPLLHRYRLRQVSWLVHVPLEVDRHVVGEQLERDCAHYRAGGFFACRDLQNIGGEVVERVVAPGHEREDRGVAGNDLVDVADHLFPGRALGA